MTQLAVLVPSRNCREWIVGTLASVADQTRRADLVVVIDDASDQPGYGDLAAAHCARYGFGYHRNEERLYCPRNLRVGVDLLAAAGLEPDGVVVILDGDDRLLPHALQVMDDVYADPDVWLTWGSYTRWPDPTFMPNPAGEWPADVVAANTYRRHYASTPFNHPLTFRRFLFDAVTDAELQDEQGRWFVAGYDAAIMFPMTELAGPEHGRFLAEVTYEYNEVNPHSDGRVRPFECDRTHRVVRGRQPRQPLVRA